MDTAGSHLDMDTDRSREKPTLRIAFDYVDPGSYLVTCLVDRALPGDRDVEITWHPLEIRVPPRPLIDPDAREWREGERAMAAEAAALDIPMVRPALVPWSRKAHELGLHAREKGCFRRVHRSLFQAHFVEGRDIGRVDVLVEIGAAHGLDRTEMKAVLDVDRYTEALLEWREEAERHRIAGVPTVLFEDERLEGFPRARLEALLERIDHLSKR